MKAIKFTLIGLSLIALVILRHSIAHAIDLSISGNGAGSQNELKINQTQNTTIQQNSNSSFDTNVNAQANTGGNETSGGNGGSITTGDSTVKVNINNQGNSNQADVTCCKAGQTPSPTPKPGQPTPTPTVPGGIGGGGDGNTSSGGGDGSGNGGGGGSSSGGTGGGQVIGLSATSGEHTTEIILTSTGIAWLLAGAYLLRKTYLLA